MRWILVLLSAVLGGILVGLAMYFLDKVGFYLIILMPILAGGIVGVATYLPVVRQSVPTLPLIVFAVIGGLIAIGIYWYGQYNDYNEQLIGLVQEQDSTATREDALALIETFQRTEYGSTGFQAFLADYAETGFSINRVARSSGLEIQGGMAYAFWGFEALVLIGMAIVGVVRRGQSSITKRLGTQAA
ncbi:MAG: hypothetical protein KJ065_22275 [Anaerolineae bacterium]|nr:hypothetical protein [Anaerolineae bacterium]